MKLRMRQNSIRFRLTQSDVGTLRNSGRCHETICFPGGSRLEYVLVVSRANEVCAAFSGGTVTIAVPRAKLTDWYSSEQVGISAAIPLQGDEILEVLIEKDFRCLDPLVREDQSDAFENPLIAHVSC